MKRIWLLLFVCGVLRGPVISGQEVVTLKNCYEKAYAASPVSREEGIFSGIWELKDKNLSRAWLPSLDASGNFIYNSSVVDMGDVIGSLPVPGIADLIRPLPHEQYKATIEVNQLLYDGGASKRARELEKTDLEINRKQVETDLYKLRSQINSCYFNLILLDRQKELQQNHQELINKRILALEAAIANGVARQSDRDVLVAEKLKLEQQLLENRIRSVSLSKILTDLTGISIGDSTRLLLPEGREKTTGELVRPELQLFDLRKKQLDAAMNLLQSKRMPKAFGFATLGYGNPPGNNFFKDEFAPYYLIGAGIKWNIFDWNKTRDEKQSLVLQHNLLNSRKEDLAGQLNRLLEGKSAEIATLESLIATDKQLIEVRKGITLVAESQLGNGMITATEYLNELNAERQAIISHELHKINLALAKVEYLNICGQEIE